MAENLDVRLSDTPHTGLVFCRNRNGGIVIGWKGDPFKVFNTPADAARLLRDWADALELPDDSAS